MAKTTKCKTPMVELRVLLSERDLYNLVNLKCTKEIENILNSLKEIIDDPETKERVKDGGNLLVNLHTLVIFHLYARSVQEVSHVCDWDSKIRKPFPISDGSVIFSHRSLS